MRGSLLTDDKSIASFHRDGFLHVRRVLDAEEVNEFRAAMDDAVATRRRNDHRALDEKSPYEQSFVQCQNVWEDFPAIRGLAFHPEIAGLAATLLKTSRVRLWHDQALYKEPGGRETDAHQDYAYWPIAEPNALTALLPLGPVSEEMGCMGYIPGSRRGACEFVDIFTKPGSGVELERKFADTPAQFVPCAPGDLIFHHSRTVHMTRANRSDRMRRAYTAIYFRDGCTRANAGSHTSLDRDNIAVGAAIDGRVTPIAWPLPSGRLPEPAPWPTFGSNTLLERAVRLGVFPGSS